MKLLLVILLFAGLLATACAPGQTEAVKETAEPEQEISAETESQEEAVEEAVDSGMEDAAAVLPESWMAYPGSKVDIDYMERGMTNYPAWQILVPQEATYQDVEEYFLTMAEEQLDFEVIDASSGSWKWKGLEVYIEILKEDNLVYSIGFPEGME